MDETPSSTAWVAGMTLSLLPGHRRSVLRSGVTTSKGPLIAPRWRTNPCGGQAGLSAGGTEGQGREEAWSEVR